MPASFSKIFFRSAKQLTRLQHKAWKQAMRAMPATLPTGPTALPPRARKSRPVAARPASPRPAAPHAGRWETQRRFLAAPGFGLAYCLYIPKRPANAAPMPLIVMLHGCKLTAEDFARGTGMNQIADRHGFAVLYPQQAVSRNATRCWRWFQPAPAQGWAEADAIAALVRKELATGCYDAQRVYAAGLSAGAGMAALLGLRHPDLVAAIAMHSGPVVGAARNTVSGLHTMRRGAMREPRALVDEMAAPAAAALGLPTLLVHGLRDAAVGERNLRQLVEQFTHINGLDGPPQAAARVVGAGTRREYRVTQSRRQGRGKALLEVIEVPGLEHAWSGGNADVKYHADHGPRASALIWRFFRAHRRRLPRA